MKRVTKTILILVAILACIVCVCCCLLIFQYFRGGMLNDRVEELATASGSSEPSPSPQASSSADTSVSDESSPFLKIDFEALAEINDEIYAWIDVPGTTISYAVVQNAKNDLFYNNHSIDKSYYSGGSIYSQRYNSKTFQDPVTVLYGHNRTSNTMFAPVNDFAQSDFFDANRYIYIYTPETVYEYEIFAAYPHSSEHLLLYHDFSVEEEFTSYFDSLSDQIDSNYRRELFPSFGDKVITLSTCYRSNRLQRYLVQGVLIAEYPAEQP